MSLSSLNDWLIYRHTETNSCLLQLRWAQWSYAEFGHRCLKSASGRNVILTETRTLQQSKQKGSPEPWQDAHFRFWSVIQQGVRVLQLVLQEKSCYSTAKQFLHLHIKTQPMLKSNKGRNKLQAFKTQILLRIMMNLILDLLETLKRLAWKWSTLNLIFSNESKRVEYWNTTRIPQKKEMWDGIYTSSFTSSPRWLSKNLFCNWGRDAFLNSNIFFNYIESCSIDLL